MNVNVGKLGCFLLDASQNLKLRCQRQYTRMVSKKKGRLEDKIYARALSETDQIQAEVRG